MLTTNNTVLSNSDTEVLNTAGSLESNVTTFNKNRTKRTRDYRKLEKKYLLIRNITGIVVIVLAIGAYASSTTIKHISSENRTIQSDLNKANAKIESQLAKMETLRLNNQSLIQGRIPGLNPINFDSPFKPENQVLKSVVFTQTQQNGKDRFEYLAVLHNTAHDVITPRSQVILFNELGVEIGRSQVGKTNSFDNNAQRITLQPKESRSFNGKITISSKEVPEYFKFITK